LLTINLQLTRRNNRSRILIFEQLERQKSNKQENDTKLRKEKRNSSCCFCKEKKRLRN